MFRDRYFSTGSDQRSRCRRSVSIRCFATGTSRLVEFAVENPNRFLFAVSRQVLLNPSPEKGGLTSTNGDSLHTRLAKGARIASTWPRFGQTS